MPTALSAMAAMSELPVISELPELNDADSFTAMHDFSKTANWLIPGRVMCGHYPGACPSRQISDEKVSENLALLRDNGVCTFVCLQDEVPPQDGVS